MDTATKWTEADLKKFDRILSRMDSRIQTKRIAGRMQWFKFRARFDKPTLDAMFEIIKEW